MRRNNYHHQRRKNGRCECEEQPAQTETPHEGGATNSMPSPFSSSSGSSSQKEFLGQHRSRSRNFQTKGPISRKEPNDLFTGSQIKNERSRSIISESSENEDPNLNSDISCRRSTIHTQDLDQYDDTVNCQNLGFCHSILKLPDDVLYVIFSFVNQSELCNLCLVCTRFSHLCSRDAVWLRHIKNTIFYSGLSDRRPWTNKELCRLTKNWEKGRFHSNFKAKHKLKLIPWLQKDDDVVWFSSGNVIRYFYSNNGRSWSENKKRSLHGMHEDATRFSVKQNMIASGCRDGSVHLWPMKSNSSHATCQITNQSEILCVDLTDHAIVSGAKDGTCTVMPITCLQDLERDAESGRSYDAGDKVWSIKASPCQGFYIAGLAGYGSPLVMLDIERGYLLGVLGRDHQNGAGVLDIKFESPHEMLTCGYDTILRMWDLRTHKCVAQWDEPYYYTLYSVTSDGGNAMAVGTARHGLVRLWDKRSTEHVQCFYSKNCNSPVYSLAMDHNNLFLAVDMGFSTMDFSIR